MNQNPRELFLQVLSIIGYSDDREEFTNKFFQLCEQQAIANLVKSLPPEQVAANLEEVTKEVFGNYLQAVYPTLNDKQKTDLDSYLKSLPSKQYSKQE